MTKNPNLIFFFFFFGGGGGGGGDVNLIFFFLGGGGGGGGGCKSDFFFGGGGGGEGVEAISHSKVSLGDLHINPYHTFQRDSLYCPSSTLFSKRRSSVDNN